MVRYVYSPTPNFNHSPTLAQMNTLLPLLGLNQPPPSLLTEQNGPLLDGSLAATIFGSFETFGFEQGDFCGVTVNCVERPFGLVQ